MPSSTRSRPPRPPASALRLALVLLLGAGACASSSAEAQRSAEMTRTIERLRTENALYARQVEELENRVFILQDRIESQRVATQKVATPELPQVRLRPEAHRPEPTGPAEDWNAQTLVADDDIEYAGDAARLGGRRPVLRLEAGSGDALPPIEIVEPRPAAVEPLPVDREGSRPVARRREAPPLAAAAAASTPPLAAAAARGPARPAPAVPERAPASSPSRAAAEAPPALGKLSALQLYQQSLEHLRAGRHEEALVGFRAFIVRFPEHDYADNAQYWIGECHYDRKDFAVAAREFRRVVERFPAGNKVPDALLKAGFSLVAVGEGAAARKTLEELVRAFPQHDAAGLATAKLNELAQRGPAAAALRPAAEEVR